ncbi:MAG TPA: lytic transglycosylase [Bacteroidales bacterium]|nr:lytic transglycosylase [Bacteroidales bacterium]
MKHFTFTFIFSVVVSYAFAVSGDSLKVNSASDIYFRKIKYIEEQTVIPSEIYNVDNTVSSFISDSVYIARIQSIPSIVNLPYNDKIRMLIERYVIKYPDQVQGLLARSDYYFPLFEEIFDAYNLPQELKYLAVIESALKPKAMSRAGAGGLWQFMRGTGKLYGLRIDEHIDERSDPVKATEAAARYLSDLYDIYDDWTLALAAYNCGPGNVKKAIRKAGGKKDFWKIYNYLPKETRSYVPIFVAATYAFHYYEAHGIGRLQGVNPILTDTVLIDKKLHFMQLAEALNISIDTIRSLNPQIRQDFIPKSDKPFKLVLPYDKAYELCGNEEMVYAWKDSIYLSEKFAKTYVATTTDEKNRSAVYHKVKSGDTVGGIATKYKVRAADVRYWNNLRGNTIRIGQKLKIMVPANLASRYADLSPVAIENKKKQAIP